MNINDYVQALVNGEFHFATHAEAWKNNGLEADDGPVYVYKNHPVYLEADGILHCQDEEGNHHMVNVDAYLPYIKRTCA